MTTPAALPRRPNPPQRQRQNGPGQRCTTGAAAAGLAALLPALLAGLHCGPAAAQVSPYYVGVSQYLGYNSNIYRLGDQQALPANDNAHKSDLVSATSLVAGIDQSFGRQRVYGSGTLGTNRYQHNSNLNGETYNLNLGLDWATINRLSGTLSASATQNLAQFNAALDKNGKVLTAKNLTNTEQVNTRVALGVVTRYTAEASLGWRRQRYSAAAYDSLEFDEHNGSLGLRYRPSDLLQLGAALRLTQASYPRFSALANGGFEPDKLKREDIDFTGQWQTSGASTVTARLSPTRTRYERNTATNFSGFTGSAGWVWAVTGKTRLSTTLSRDTAQSAQAASLGVLGNRVSDYGQITNALQLRADHELTGKISLNTTLTYANRSLNSNLTFSGLPLLNQAERGSDNDVNLALGARWAPTRGSQVGCDISTERRSTTNTRLSLPLSAALFSCYGQLTLQSL